MPETLQTIAQACPAAATNTDLYTVAASHSVVASLVSVCNQNAGTAKIRIWVAPSGAVTDSTQYKYYDYPIPGNYTSEVLHGMTLGAADVLRVRSDIGGVSFGLHGSIVS